MHLYLQGGIGTVRVEWEVWGRCEGGHSLGLESAGTMFPVHRRH